MVEELLSGILALIFLAGAFMQYQCRGPIWSAEYFAASSRERKKMRTREEYFFSATACLLIGISFLVLMIYLLTDMKLFLYMIFLFSALLFLLIVYGVFRTVKKSMYRDKEEEKRRRRRK